MRPRNEFLVGLSIIVALAVVIAGGLFLSQADVRGTTMLQTTRFRSVGRLQPGSPVLLRGVRVGTVQAVRLADNNWVEADLRLDRRVEYPDRPAILVASSSLLGEWQAQVLSLDELPEDRALREAFEAAARGAGSAWPGTDLPGIGELTAQASRIANDIGLITSRVEGAIDSSVIADLRASVGDLRAMADRLLQFTREETNTIGRITGRAGSISEQLDVSSAALRNTLTRVDTATSRGELADIFGNARSASANLRDVTADMKTLAATVRENQDALVRTMAGLDSVMTRIQRGQGTLAKLTMDSTLYVETTAAVSELRALIADIRLNPRKYFRFSVF